MKLEPDLTNDAWSLWQKFPALTPELVALYSATSDVAAETLARLSESVVAGLAPLKPIAPNTFNLLERYSDTAYFVDMRFPSSPESAGKLYLILETPSGFCSFCMHDTASRLGSYPQRIQNFPSELQGLADLTSSFKINYSQDFANLTLADVYASAFDPYFLTTIEGFVSKKSKSSLKKLFPSMQSLDELVVIAHDHAKSWCLFFLDSAQSDRSIWLGTGNGIESTHQVKQPLKLYDQLVTRYIAEGTHSVDFMLLQKFLSSKST
ncbi:hypothetical protein [Parachitinimonas caeni]|uniref:Uncharacterized protein n=1 Tax=Parachitinimonas caeni TaxID=3031301 RepID=A0ABT7DVP8_9NEIS|nr:hypothetical protein [Parachitinimonas caeni]MDK2123924.1 hypothetical protein [Parachitinimonas caeni]